MCISLARRFIVPRGLHTRLGIEIMVWGGRHHLCAVHVVHDMQYSIVAMCSVLGCFVCVFSSFSEHVVLRSCTASCGTSSIFISQMAAAFWNAIRTDVSFGVFIINTRNPVFYPFVLFQAMRSGSVWFTWLKWIIILPFYCNAIIVWSLEMFCVVSQAFTSMLAKRGTVLCVDVLGTTLMDC